tara:strand:+ start:659 stop:901 length:243 start_codon:yes stop_codon:yes gene_type:complete
MGFHKRHLCKESLISQYTQKGASGVIEFISKPDALFYSDEFSNLLLSLPLQWEGGKPTAVSIQMVNQIFDDEINTIQRNK